jgi:hypothetical protein
MSINIQRILVSLATFLVSPMAYSDLMLKEGWIIRRHTPSSQHLFKQADAVANGYSWTPYFNAVTNAAKRINSGPHNYSISAAQAADSASFGNGNSKDEIYFGAIGGAGFLAVTYQRHVRVRDVFGNTTGFNMVEGDIVLNTAQRFHTGGANAWQLNGKATVDLEETLIHEMGHAMALNHTGNHRDNMGAAGCGLYANGTSGTGYMGQSMTGQLQSVYGSWGGGYGDIAISAYNYIDTFEVAGQLPYANCGYSDKNNMPPVNVISNLTINRSYLRSAADRAWALVVAPGDWVSMKFTVEATKPFSQVPATLYFSTNNVISTSDVALWNFTITPSSGTRIPFVMERQFQMPFVATRGFAAIGVILDPSNTVSEWSKNNNIAYFPIYITD